MRLNASAVAAACFVAIPVSAASPSDGSLEELLVTARHDTRTIDVVDTLSVTPDPARLLMAAPGANVNSNGPITGIPQYRGLFGQRVAVSLDGNALAPAGPNWMDPPISYAVTAQLDALEVYRGITPVSVAQETLGGVIDARTRRLGFTDSDDFRVSGKLSASGQSVNNGQQFDADVQAANRQHRVKLAAMQQSGGNTRFPGGEILPSEYSRYRLDAGYGFRWGNHSLQLDYGYNDTGESGTPALPMDIDYFTGDLASLRYRHDGAAGVQTEVAVYTSQLDHGMTNYHLRQPPGNAAMWRQNIASADNVGFRWNSVIPLADGTLRVGADGFSEIHQSDIDNPNNPMFFVVNFNDAERQILGAFVEWESDVASGWQWETGARVNHIGTDSGEVDATPARMMPPAMALRDAFNAADRSRSDVNVDLFAKLSHAMSEHTSLYSGIARKTRAPSFQERYLWLPLEATAGLADGQLYVGRIDLDAEQAWQFELGVDYDNGWLQVAPRAFWYRIDDYIQGTPVQASDPAAMFVTMMNMANGTNRAAPLQFSNVEAELYGLDVDWSWQLSETFSLSGVLSAVRGERRDIDDNLYRIAPPNASFALNYRERGFGLTVETVAYSAQDDVSATNREQASPGYGVVNLRGSWALTDALQLALGAENLFDRRYTPHLGGYNRAGNPDVGLLERLPAPGLNVFGRVVYQF